MIMGTATGKSRVALTVTVAVHYMCSWGDPEKNAIIFVLCVNKWLRDRDQSQGQSVIEASTIHCHYVESIDALLDHPDLRKTEGDLRKFLIVDESDIVLVD